MFSIEECEIISHLIYQQIHTFCGGDTAGFIQNKRRFCYYAEIFRLNYTIRFIVAVEHIAWTTCHIFYQSHTFISIHHFQVLEIVEWFIGIINGGYVGLRRQCIAFDRLSYDHN